MRAYMESGFYLVYLVLIFAAGVRLLLVRDRQGTNPLFGMACLLLGFGDAVHLIPRAVGLFTKTLDAPSPALAAWLGTGKLITSITMTLFYLLLYFFLFKRTGAKRPRFADAAVFLLVPARLILCAFPQNGWITNDSPLSWGIARNVPFALLGALVIVLAFRLLRKQKPFRLLWLAVTLSFAFYLPVVVWAGTHAWVGMLMLPKTVCYLWIAGMGVFAARHGRT